MMDEKSRPFCTQDDAAAKAAGLRAAVQLFVRNGIDATTVRDIAAASGFTNPAIFKHFDSKEDMALYLFERCYLWMGGAVRAAEEGCQSNRRAKIMAVVACCLRLIDEDNEAVLFVQENLRRFWRETAQETRRFSLLGSLRALIGGEEGPGSAPNLQASAIIGFLGQLARETYFGELPGPAAQQAAAVNAIVMRILNEDRERL